MDAGLAELEALRREASGIPPQEPGDNTPELADFRRQVQQLRQERDNWLSNRGGSLQTDGFGGNPTDPSSLMLGLVEAGDAKRRCLGTSTSSVLLTSSCSRDARYGLRGVRIGEASHPGLDGGFMLRLGRGQNRFSVLSDEVQPTVPNVSQSSDIESVIDALEFDLSREEDRVQHHAIGTPVPASDTEGSSEVEHEESDRESVVANEMESPTYINDVSLEAEDVSEAPLSFGAAARAAMERFDDVDLESEFVDRACVMKSLPNFLRGMYRCAMRVALTEADRRREGSDQVGLTRAWKMFMLHKSPRRGLIPTSRLKERFSNFPAGRWVDLLCQGRVCAEQAAVASRRRRRRSSDDVQRRAERAHALSASRHAQPRT